MDSLCKMLQLLVKNNFLKHLLFALLLITSQISWLAASPVDHCESYQGQSLDLSNAELIREQGIELQYEGYNNLEGPAWINGALFYSNIGNKRDSESGELLNNLTTIWRWVPGTKAEIWLDDSRAGTNGIAVGSDGNLIVARHLDGSVSRVDIQTKSISPIATAYNGRRFNSPNDLTLLSNGTIFFTDPDWNVPNSNTDPIQGGENQHIYRINPTGKVSRTRVTDLVRVLGNKPNGIITSLDERDLLVAGLEGLWKFQIASGGLSQPLRLMTTPIDGMGKDCSGNIYVTTSRTNDEGIRYQAIVILDEQYKEVGEIAVPDIQIVTNIAFGGPEMSTLYLTSLTVPMNDAGTGPRMCAGQPCQPAGIYSVRLNVPGFPY